MTTRELFAMDLGDGLFIVGALAAWLLAFAAVLS